MINKNNSKKVENSYLLSLKLDYIIIMKTIKDIIEFAMIFAGIAMEFASIMLQKKNKKNAKKVFTNPQNGLYYN